MIARLPPCNPVRLLTLALFASAGTLPAQVSVNVTLAGQINTPNPTTDNVPAALVTHAGVALLEWTQWLQVSGPRSIEVEVRIEPFPTGTGGGGSLTSAFVGSVGGLDTFQQGVAAELATGVDPNGATPDARIAIDPAYLEAQLWFDPDPSARTIPVAGNRIDAASFFLHEFGHVLAFTGWKNQATGAAPGYQSTFDQRRRFDAANWWWTGSRANQLYGGELPLSRVANTFDHYGNPSGSGAPGADSLLINGLMNGVVFNYGQRYRIGLLDLAMLADTGIALVPAIDFTAPHLTLTINPRGTRRLQWPGIPLANYTLQSRTSLNEPWGSLGTRTVAGTTPQPLVFDDAGESPAGGEQYYQVLLQP